jgi:hypothetical protein
MRHLQYLLKSQVLEEKNRLDKSKNSPHCVCSTITKYPWNNFHAQSSKQYNRRYTEPGTAWPDTDLCRHSFVWIGYITNGIHCATYVSLISNINYNRAYTRKVWVYKNADLVKLNSLIENCDWANIINGADTEHIAAENFTSKFLSCVRQCIPENIVTIRPHDKPWYDSMLRKTIRLRDRLRNKALKTQKDSDWSAYRKLRTSVNNMKKHEISNYYDNIETYLDDSSKDNTKLYWKLMKDSFNMKLSTP